MTSFQGRSDNGSRYKEAQEAAQTESAARKRYRQGLIWHIGKHETSLTGQKLNKI